MLSLPKKTKRKKTASVIGHGLIFLFLVNIHLSNVPLENTRQISSATRAAPTPKRGPLYVEAGLSTLLTAGVTCRLRVASGLTFSTFDSDRKSQSGPAGRNEGSKRTDTIILLKLAQAGKADIHEMLLAGDEALVARPLRVVKVVAALAVGLDLNFRISYKV